MPRRLAWARRASRSAANSRDINMDVPCLTDRSWGASGGAFGRVAPPAFAAEGFPSPKVTESCSTTTDWPASAIDSGRLSPKNAFCDAQRLADECDIVSQPTPPPSPAPFQPASMPPPAMMLVDSAPLAAANSQGRQSPLLEMRSCRHRAPGGQPLTVVVPGSSSQPSPPPSPSVAPDAAALAAAASASPQRLALSDMARLIRQYVGHTLHSATERRRHSAPAAEGLTISQRRVPKRVRFSDHVSVEAVYSADEYDRTSIKVAPWTPQDLHLWAWIRETLKADVQRQQLEFALHQRLPSLGPDCPPSAVSPTVSSTVSSTVSPVVSPESPLVPAAAHALSLVGEDLWGAMDAQAESCGSCNPWYR